MTKKPPPIVEAKVIHCSKEGHGLARALRSDGERIDVEVPFTLPGDLVQIELHKRRRKLYRSRLLEILEPSPERIEARCLHFGKCGGCQLQHTPYVKQLTEKEEKIEKLFLPFIDSETRLYPIIPCDDPWHYRNKMELTFSSDKKGERYLGLILYGTRGHVFQMEECSLMKPWMMRAVEVLKTWWVDFHLEAYRLHCDQGTLRTVTLREGEASGDRMVLLTLSGNPDYALNQKQMNALVESLKEKIQPESTDAFLSIFIRIQQIAKGEPTQFYEIKCAGPDFIRESLTIDSVAGGRYQLNFQVSPTAFFQPNTKQAQKLYARAIDLTGLSQEDVVYDLYCGTGTLGLCLAKSVKRVIGIELVPESVLDGRENIQLNGLENVTIHQGDVAALLPCLLAEERPSVIFVDPPRSGLTTQALEELLKIKPSKLTYISCNPVTQAANLETLIKGGYRLQAIQPVDQFPHTVHVENIVTLTC